MLKPTLLIDGDGIVYKSCIACERDMRWDDAGNHVLFSNETEAFTAVEGELEKLFDRFDVGASNSVIALSNYEVPVFRLGIDDSYKANRVSLRKPLCFWDVRKMLEAKYRVVSMPGLEADDILGIFATREPNHILVSEDKDMKTLPCTLYRQGELKTYSEQEADYHHLLQTLTGDVTDGYPGCPGSGPVKAAKTLGFYDTRPTPWTVKGAWPAVVASFEKAGKTADDALRQARLARILRNSDWDATKKEPILWCPPT